METSVLTNKDHSTCTPFKRDFRIATGYIFDMVFRVT